jgi:hypothetical protein
MGYGMCFVLRKIPIVLWELWRFLGLKGCWEVVMFGLANSALNFCPIFETKPCEVVELIFYGDFVVGYELPAT